ncbi:D-alanyl-D-alanine carboxypeptidase [bacterium]|nr:D-alanyl-D-alanine carboxypeptidase [bacterium]NBX72119.1 D-alanyl-D-alanine carboxypeptidase [bacterium]
MDKIIRSLLKISLIMITTAYCHAFKEKYIPAAPILKAKAYVLMDYHSGQVLASSNPDLLLEPASLTKMMTMYVLDDDLKNGRVSAEDLVRISSKARHIPGSRMYLEQNTHVPISDLIKGIIVQSGNDASVAVAEHLAGDEDTFAQLMNVHAKRLGMMNTTFKNATGLPQDGHLSTAYDLALLSRSLIRDFPDSYHLYAQKSFKYNNIDQNNRNRLLWENPYVDGIKTGHTDTAGFCLASSAIKDQTRLISVLIGAESDKVRSFESIRLLSYGFRFFETVKMQLEEGNLGKERIWFGDKKFVDLALKDDLYVTIPARQQDLLRTQLRIQDKLIAPLRTDQIVGYIDIYLEDDLLQEIPVYLAEPVKPAGLISRGLQKIGYFMQVIREYWTQ